MIFRNAHTPAQESGDGWDSLRRILAGRDSDEVYGRNALQVETVYTCIRILAETLGKLPIKVYRSTGVGQEQVLHDLSPLLKLRPNPDMSAIDFWKCMETQRNLYGNAYAWLNINRGSGKIQSIYPLNSQRMTMYIDNVGLFSSSQRIWYCYSDDAGNLLWLNPAEVLHFKGLTTDGIAGLSAIEALRINIENAKSSGAFLNNSYKKGMMVSGVLQYVGDLDSAGQANIRRKFEQMAGGVVNANRIAVMPPGMKFEPFQMKLTDAQFLENTRFTVQQLTAAFGIKPHQVNDLTKSSYASVSESNREFHADTMMSILTAYEQEISWKCFLPKEIESGYYVKFNADAITRGDPEKRYAMYSNAVQNAVSTPNECRALEDRPPLPGGDVLLVNSALVPVESLGDRKENGEKGGE